MMEIKYPEIIYCPRCELEIRLDYSGKRYAKTSDVFKLWVEIPSTGESATNLRKKIVTLPPTPKLTIKRQWISGKKAMLLIL